jgi:iron complex outermembrane receptor protein
LKKGVSVGTTGNINFRYDQGIYGAASAGFSLTKGMGRVRTYLTYQYMHRNFYEDIDSDRRLQADTLLAQSSATRYFSGNHYIGAGLDLPLNKKVNLTYDLRFTATRDNNQAISLNAISKSGDQHPFVDSRTSIDNNGRSTVLTNTVAMRYKIDSVNSVWANEIEYTRSNSSGTQSYITNYDLPANASISGYGNLSHHAQAISFRSDLSLSIFYRLTLETGLKISRATDKNGTEYFSQQGASPVQPDTFQTTAYKYTGNISSAYTQLSKKVYGFILKAGLRFENTAITGNQSIPRPASFGIQRNDLFPYLYIRRNLFTIFGYPLTGNAIYRKSITRPDFDALNPAPRFIDQYTYETGNSALKPQLTANYEVNATYDDFPVFAIGLNDARDAFSRVTYKNEQTGIVYRTWDNIGSYRELYARLFGGLPSGRKYFMYVGVQCNYVHYQGAYQQTPLQYKRTSWSFFTGHSLKASSTMSFNLNGWMYVNGFRLFNELKTMGQLNLSVTKNAFHKKVNIIVSANDILKTNKSLFAIDQGPVQVTGARIQDSRRVGITVKYNFGTVRTEEKKPAFVVPEATDGTSH